MAFALTLRTRLPAILVAVTMLPSVSSAAGNAANGKALAQIWCSNCHLVEGSSTGKDTAPTLADIARRGGPQQLEARAFLASPHPPMPNFDLARQQVDDIVAYLKTMATR